MAGTSYYVRKDGVYERSPAGPTKVCEHPLDIVRYSDIDREFYVRWPLAGSCDQMAAIPREVIDGGTREDFVDWLNIQGIRVEDAMVDKMLGYLGERAEAFTNA